MSFKHAARLTLLLCSLSEIEAAEQGWWMTEPIRWVQTNLRQTDAKLDPDRFVGQLSDMHANVLLMGMGGLAAFYPTKTPFHYPSPDLPPGVDLFGQVLAKAHAHGIRVVGRYDLSKTTKAVYDAHPEWFFRKADGSPAIYNGFYSTCINGGYYRDQAMKILTEGLQTYDVDGLFFNMFGNQAKDYSGRPLGLCHCDACQRKFQAMFHRSIPTEPDDEYRRFMFISSREVAAAIGDLIHRIRPKSGYFNYIQEATDGIMSESNTAIDRPLPLWPYSASDNVNRARNSQPGKMAVNLCMQFADYMWRFATVPQQEIATRLWENVANGGALAFEVNGTLDQQDRQAKDTAKPIFQWLADHQQYYAREESAARVLLLGGSAKTGKTYSQNSYRGLFRLLTEQHIPFAVSDNLDWMGKRQFDLVVASDWAPKELEQYAKTGGHVLVVSANEPDFTVAPVVKKWTDMKAYFRVRDHKQLPSLAETDLLLTDGAYTELKASPQAALTLIPPSLFAPPELVHVDMKDTDKPGLAFANLGSGSVAWIPWDMGAIYYRESLPAHAALFRDVVNHLNPRRQLETNAHPLIEMTWMKQDGRQLVHLINLIGHSDTAYFPPVPVHDIKIKMAGTFTSAQSLRSPRDLIVISNNGYSDFTLPELSDYELIVVK